MFTETMRVNEMIRQGGAGLTELQFFAREIREWLSSPRRIDQITGEKYYLGQHDILDRKRTVIGEDGKLREIENLPNNRIVDNQYAKMVDQKANYLLGKPLTFETENKGYGDLLKDIFDKRMHRTMKGLAADSLNGGIGWLHPYYDENQKLRLRRFHPYEILPFWQDDEHNQLDCFVRLYDVEVYMGQAKQIIHKVEIYKPDGVTFYTLDGETLVPDTQQDAKSYFTVSIGKKARSYNWHRLPLIPFRYNDKEQPLVRRVKSLQDGINTMMSDFENNMQEDARNTILVLTNYDGTELGEFRQNLAQYGAVKVLSDGGLEALTVEVDSENYKTILELFKKALIENARGFDAKDDRMGGTPNQMNIQSMYSDIDLDANGMETEYQAALMDLLWFVNQHLNNTGQGAFDGEDVTFIFNRDILINETEAIENCQKSSGILSTETIVSQHPWTKDPETELKRLAEEKEQAMKEYGASLFDQQLIAGQETIDHGEKQ